VPTDAGRATTSDRILKEVGVLWLSAALREFVGLFVDDVPYTAGIVVWVGAGTVTLPEIAIDPVWDAPLLAAGCALVLVVSSRWAAMEHRRRLEECVRDAKMGPTQ
jgi:hypothetical protein